MRSARRLYWMLREFLVDWLKFSWWRDEANRGAVTAILGALKIIVPAVIVVVVFVMVWFGLQKRRYSFAQPNRCQCWWR